MEAEKYGDPTTQRVGTMNTYEQYSFGNAVEFLKTNPSGATP